MSPSRPTRTVCLALALALSSCSIATVTPHSSDWTREPECTTSVAAPILDVTALLVVAVGGGLLTVMSLGDCIADNPCSQEFYRNPLAGTIALAVPFLVSSVFGTNEVVRCRNARDDWERRQP